MQVAILVCNSCGFIKKIVCNSFVAYMQVTKGVCVTCKNGFMNVNGISED